MKAKQSGFTLVELVTTITIVGVLAAVAIPRLVGVNADARAVVIRDTAVAMKQGNQAIFAKAATAHKEGLSAGTIIFPYTIAGGVSNGVVTTATINVVYGHAATVADLVYAMVVNPDLNSSSADVTIKPDGDASIPTDGVTSKGSIQHTKAVTPSSCLAGYVPPQSAVDEPSYPVVVNNWNKNGNVLGNCY